MIGCIKAPKFSKSVKGVAPTGRLFTQKWKFLIFWGRIPTPAAIEVKFCTAKRTHLLVAPANFDVNRCNKSPLRGEKPDFWPVSFCRFAASCRDEEEDRTFVC